MLGDGRDAPGGRDGGNAIELVLDSRWEALNEAHTNIVPRFPQAVASRSAGEVEFLMLVLGTGYSAEEPSTLEMQNQVGL